MTDYVIDTNVWIMVDRLPDEIQDHDELDCHLQCVDWLSNFVRGEDRLVVDWDYKILGEYRRHAARGELFNRWLNQLERQNRLIVNYQVQFDAQGYAVVPESLAEFDPSDKKFIAVARDYNPILLIVNATDTDWAKSREILEAEGITVQELCSAYIEMRLAERGA
jgi:hypothetical protein